MNEERLKKLEELVNATPFNILEDIRGTYVISQSNCDFLKECRCSVIALITEVRRLKKALHDLLYDPGGDGVHKRAEKALEGK